MNINIPGIDIEKAIKNSGSEKLFIELLGDIYKLMDEKIERVESYLAQKNIQNFTVEVHSLKTTCRTIGAMDLGEDFYTLEKLGKENNLEQIEALTPGVLNSFKALKPYLEPFAKKDESNKSSYDKEAFSAILNELITAIDDFNLGAAEAAVKQLFSYDCDSELLEKLNSLDKLITNLDYDEAKELSNHLLSSL
ncbi:HPt (histidine-containing phosphotransfer) domain-containing protein [Pseudobutyrivibrio sp. YE44]|uniref:Hpt domain-containing protein n=1 Tax=Pseudobutyrivibrio sp. YE44 TaxID=1520802 RepID=UPI00088130B9|nr:Hpt domain-containing protein [Pseudobutyrivibrio sp. YE44]SDB49987.1 HPt (histidine-containing phosphotransfer) domain-containing protein [Pseudobutyrivibrio sp. YE44]